VQQLLNVGLQVDITALNTEACWCKYCMIYLPEAPVDPEEPVDPVTALPGGPRLPEGPVAPGAPVSPGGPEIAIIRIPPTHPHTPVLYTTIRQCAIALSLGMKQYLLRIFKQTIAAQFLLIYISRVQQLVRT